jgi:hypothetical protein
MAMPAFEEAWNYFMGSHTRSNEQDDRKPSGRLFSIMSFRHWKACGGLTTGIFSLTERGNRLWTLMIRLPDFCHRTRLSSSLHYLEAEEEKPGGRKLRFDSFREGLCVQALHVGPYATEPETMLKIEALMAAKT